VLWVFCAGYTVKAIRLMSNLKVGVIVNQNLTSKPKSITTLFFGTSKEGLRYTKCIDVGLLTVIGQWTLNNLNANKMDITISKEEHERLLTCEKESVFLKNCLNRIDFTVPTAALCKEVGSPSISKFRDKLCKLGYLKKLGHNYLPTKWSEELGICWKPGNDLNGTIFWTLKGRVLVLEAFNVTKSNFIKDFKF